MILLRKISFWLAIAGLVSAGALVLSFRTQLNQPMTCASPAVQSSAEYGRSVKET